MATPHSLDSFSLVKHIKTAKCLVLQFNQYIENSRKYATNMLTCTNVTTILSAPKPISN